MRRQDYRGPVQWVIVDDGADPVPLGNIKKGWQRTVIRPEPLWRPGLNSQGRNLYAGVCAAQALASAGGYDLRLAIVEDDDFYQPDWLRTVDGKLDSAELVGEAPARYYNVRWRQWSTLGNYRHACLRASAMRGAAVESFLEVLRTPHIYYDYMLWLNFRQVFAGVIQREGIVFDGNSTVGIKGMPGPLGVAGGHEADAGKPDDDWIVLRKWLGDDWKRYKRFYEKEADMAEREMIALVRFEYDKRVLQPGDKFVVVRRTDGYTLNRGKKARYADPDATGAPPAKAQTLAQEFEPVKEPDPLPPEPAPPPPPPEPEPEDTFDFLDADEDDAA